jgi:hypothetical protein
MMQQQIVKGKISKLGGTIAKEGERADVVCLSDAATPSDAAAAAAFGAQVLKRKWVEDSIRDNKLADREPYLLSADPTPSALGKRANDGPAGAGTPAAREAGEAAEVKKPRVDAFSTMMGAGRAKALDLQRSSSASLGLSDYSQVENRERIFLELMTSDRTLNASRESSK